MTTPDPRWVNLSDLEVRQLADAAKLYLAFWEKAESRPQTAERTRDEQELWERWVGLRDSLRAEVALREVRRARMRREAEQG